MTAKTLIVRFPAAVCILLILFVGQSLGQETKLTWYGHAAFSITTPNGKVLLIDPWLTNPANPEGQKSVASLQKVDYILITHGHRDHIGDAVEIAKNTGAKLIANPELAANMVKLIEFPKAQTEAFREMERGETLRFQGKLPVRVIK